MGDYYESLKSSVTDLHDQLPPWARYAIVGAGAFGAIYYIKNRNSGLKRPLKTDFVKDKVYVYQFPRCRYLPTISPFALKLETWLRMANIDYENVDRPDIFSVRSSEGTLPFVELNGKEYVDSAFIIRDLTQIFKKDGMLAHLSDAEKGQLRAIEQMTENTTLVTYAFFRYTQHLDVVFGVLPIDKYFGTIEQLIWKMFMPFMKSGIMKRMKANPNCKHSDEEIINITNDDLRALSDILADKPYFLGSKPTRTDALVFSVIAQINYLPIELACKSYLVHNAKNLVEHCERIKKEFWPDWHEATTAHEMNTHLKAK